MTSTCDTIGCDETATHRFWALRPDGTRRAPHLLCDTDAVRAYNVLDRNRRGGKCEYELLPITGD